MKLNFYAPIVALIIFSAFTNCAYADSAIRDEILAKLDSWGINRPTNELYLDSTVFDNPLNTSNAKIDDTRIGIYTSRVDGRKSIFAYLNNEKITDIFRQRVDPDNNFYAAI